jgi:hypothetical protein
VLAADEVAMASAAASASQPSIAIRVVLRDTWSLYKELFGRTVLTGGLVFGSLALLDVVLRSGPAGNARLVLTVFALALPVVGTALVQGALVEAVNDEHEGWKQGSIGDLYRTAWERIGPLVGVSLLTGLGAAAAALLLVVPGIVLLVRWSLAVPVVMLEKEAPRAAMRRSRELVRGHGWAVFRVLLNVGIASAILSGAMRFLAIAMLGRSHLTLATWVGATFGGAIATPYLSHALSVLYYRLAQPDRPVIADTAAPSWGTIWDEQR